MEQSHVNNPPKRITDLIDLKKGGANLVCRTEFEILPVDFEHRDNPFRAYVFLCCYTGSIDGEEFLFRKCYARGCPHNLCPHVSQAVMIANRYLQRDYVRLKQGGIYLEEKLFTLDEMVVKFEDLKEKRGAILTIHDYIKLAKEGNSVSVEIALEYVPAVEHFANHKNPQTFLTVDFTIDCLESINYYERCLACYPTEEADGERKIAAEVANERLRLLYQEFDAVGITYEKHFFE
jgi:hypothetical protein